jgi:hypothetical protein
VASESDALVAQFKGAFENAVHVVAAYGALLHGSSGVSRRAAHLPFERAQIKEALFFLHAVLQRAELKTIVCEQYPDGAWQVLSGGMARGVAAGIRSLPEFLSDAEADLMDEYRETEGKLPEVRLEAARAILERKREEADALMAEAQAFKPV